VDLQQFQAAPGQGAFLNLHGSRSLVHLQVQAGLLINFGSAPLVLRNPSTGAVSTAVVAHQTTTDLMVAIGLFDWAEIGLALPLTVQGTNPAPVLGETFRNGLFPAGLGDLRLVPKVTLVDMGPLWLGLAATLTLPTGSGAALLGSGALGARPRVLAEYEVAPGTRLLVNAGANLRPEVRLLNLTVGSELAYGLGAESRVLSQLLEGLTVAGGLSGALGLSASQSEERPLELLVEGRYAVSAGLTASLGGGFGLSRGYGTPAFRVLLGVTWAQAAERAAGARALWTPAPGSSLPPPPPPDADGDGIVDEKDRCPREPETQNGHQDSDGCPDQAPPVRLEMPPPPPGFSPTSPPPPPPPPAKGNKDADGDKVPDDLDLCPDEAGDGNPSGDGCPPDADSDGIPDARDACPDRPETINDFEEEDGCPDQAPGGRKTKKRSRRR
jgi:hypothetical protein